MRKSFLLKVLSLILVLSLLVSDVRAQLTDVIPSSAFIRPTSVPTNVKSKISPPPLPTVTNVFQNEGNVLGISQRNPALTESDKNAAKPDLIGNFVLVLLLVFGGFWFYQNRKNILSSIKKPD